MTFCFTAQLKAPNTSLAKSCRLLSLTGFEPSLGCFGYRSSSQFVKWRGKTLLTRSPGGSDLPKLRVEARTRS